MEPIGTYEGFEVIFINTALVSKNRIRRGFPLIGKNSGHMYYQWNLGIRDKRRKKKGMCVATLFTLNPDDG